MIDNKTLAEAFRSLGDDTSKTTDQLEAMQKHASKVAGPLEKALEDDPKAGDMATDAFEKIAGIMKSVPRLYANVPLAYQKLQKAYAYHKAQGKKKK